MWVFQTSPCTMTFHLVRRKKIYVHWSAFAAFINIGLALWLRFFPLGLCFLCLFFFFNDYHNNFSEHPLSHTDKNKKENIFSPVIQDLLFLKRASLMAQQVKSLPAMRETQIHSLGQGEEKGMATHPSILEISHCGFDL